MLVSRVPGRAAQLKNSYIAISTYIRRDSYASSFSCHRGFACHAARRNTEQQETSGSAPQDAETGKELQATLAQTATSRGHDARMENYKKIFTLPKATANWLQWDLRPHNISTIHGYVTAIRRAGKGLVFIDMADPQLRKTLQLVIDTEAVGDGARDAFQRLRPHTPVTVSGQIRSRAVDQKESSKSSTQQPLSITYYDAPTPAERKAADDVQVPKHEFKKNPYVGEVFTIPQIEMAVTSITILNHFPDDIIAQADTKFPPDQRHLQLRTDSDLRRTLQVRSKAQTECRKYLFMKAFDEIETPILFKSTPEGAREFLVPTRHQGLAYALPQSPQQFKQILMASGVSRYFQFAKCFRDENLRADRQPEFTQLDIEMSFVPVEEVMKITERIIQVLWHTFFGDVPGGTWWAFSREYQLHHMPANARLAFSQLTYHEAMTSWGSDKPDTRLGSRIYQIQDGIEPAVRSKFTSLENPIMDVMRVKVSHNGRETREYVQGFFDHPSRASYLDNPHGSPGVFIFDSSKPMNGLSGLEHDAAERVANLLHPTTGDLIVVQARPDRPFAGEGSTAMGNLRRDLHTHLVSEGMLRPATRDEHLWIRDFPLFSPATDSDPGQGGKAGIKSTHHPFTAPKTSRDIDYMMTDPLKCTGDHFDLVINGIEVGGGSRRIHDSKVQEMVLKEILEVPDDQAEHFRPLLEALRAGCPPHAGIALGFDRLVAIMRRVKGVRDVIAFPKSANGEDKMMGAPSAVTTDRWQEYHMSPQVGEAS